MRYVHNIPRPDAHDEGFLWFSPHTSLHESLCIVSIHGYVKDIRGIPSHARAQTELGRRWTPLLGIRLYISGWRMLANCGKSRSWVRDSKNLWFSESWEFYPSGRLIHALPRQGPLVMEVIEAHHTRRCLTRDPFVSRLYSELRVSSYPAPRHRSEQGFCFPI